MSYLPLLLPCIKNGQNDTVLLPIGKLIGVIVGPESTKHAVAITAKFAEGRGLAKLTTINPVETYVTDVTL